MEQTAPEIEARVTWLEEEVAVDLALVASGVDQALSAKTAKTAALGSKLTPYGLVAVMHVMHCC
jgi:hypothetical protein